VLKGFGQETTDDKLVAVKCWY